MKTDLPGTIYKNANRYWWRVRLPGEKTRRAIPLIPEGSKYAANDLAVAIAVAENIYNEAVFNAQQPEHLKDGTIADLVSAYLTFAKTYYRHSDGTPTKEPITLKYCLQYLLDMYGQTPANSFGPFMLKKVREKMIEGKKKNDNEQIQGLCRNEVNRRVKCIRRFFKWAVSEQLVSAMIYQSLCCLEPLKKGRCDVRESEEVTPAPEDHVLAVLPYTTPVVAAMIQLQLYAGMRSGEMVIMRPCDIDRNEKVWLYRPEHHKTEHHGHKRIVAFGPKAQEVVKPFLEREPEQYCFSPIESEQLRRAKLHEQRKTPMSCGNKPGTNVKDKPETAPTDRYTTVTYGRAVTYAIKAAIKAGEKIEHFTPHRIRHTTGTKAGNEVSLDAASAVLGHKSVSVTLRYVQRDKKLAAKTAELIG